MNNPIIIVANKYPNPVEPNVNVFTQQLAWSFADCGAECIVICPTAINYNRNNKNIEKEYIEKTDTNKNVKVIRPTYFGLGQSGSLLQKPRVSFTTYMYTRTVESVLQKYIEKKPVLFAEFICPAGVTVSYLGEKYQLKTFLQCGESTYQGNEKYGNSALKSKLKGIDCLIALSGHVKKDIVNAGIIDEEKIIIMPSGYRKNVIQKKDKMKSRDELNLPKDKFIVGFCGTYNERKGIQRLVKAMDMIDDDEIVLAAVGKGELWPKSPKLVMSGPLHHSNLSAFYSAIDVFAFPTYDEGCCTAIVEATACGSPIISSDRDFNYEICDDTNSILIDPDDILAMKEKILLLKHNKTMKEQLAHGSYVKSQDFDLVKKAERIIEYAEQL